MNRPDQFETDAVATVTTAATTILERTVGGVGGVICFEVQNEGAVALNGFDLQIKAHPAGAWSNYLTDTDFDDANNANLFFVTVTRPHTLAGPAKAVATVRVQGAYAVRFRAHVASGTTTVSIRGTTTDQ